MFILYNPYINNLQNDICIISMEKWKHGEICFFVTAYGLASIRHIKMYLSQNINAVHNGTHL